MFRLSLTPRVLHQIFLASLWRRRLATFLSLLAIALGVALGLAVHLIHSAALDEFDQGMRQLAGEADLQILGPYAGFDDSLYLLVAAQPAIAGLSPVLEAEAVLPELRKTLRIAGVDAFRVASVSPALSAQVDASVEDGRLAVLRPENVFLSPAALQELGRSPGEFINVKGGVSVYRLRIAGTLPAAGVGRQIAVMDIAAAQQLFARTGYLSRIDVRLQPGYDRHAVAAQLQTLLPAGIEVLAPEAVQAQNTALSKAYRVNMSMLAAIALLTGGFLVFSTQLLSVVRRRRELAFLRAMGMDRPAILQGLLAEGALIGLLGGAGGVLLGYALTALGFYMIGADLGAGFFQGMHPQLKFQPVASLGYLLLGILAGTAGAWLPAREAVALIPAQALKAGDEAGVLPMQRHWRTALACLLTAGLLCLAPPLGGVPVAGYAAVVLILFGSVLILPETARLTMGLLRHSRSVPLRLAHARLTAAPGQAVVAGAGVVVSVALAVALAIMVASFRVSVEDWLSRILPSDLYVRAASVSGSGFMPPQAVERIAALPGVKEVQPVRFNTVRMGEGRFPMTLIARKVGDAAYLPLVRRSAGPVANPENEYPVWLSEAAVDLLGADIGAHLDLPLGSRTHRFVVAGIWRDYARQHGALIVELATYRELSGDTLSSDIGVLLGDGATMEQVVREIDAAFDEGAVEIASPGSIRARTLTIFDRTFFITYLMEAVAVLIGLFGICTSFAALASSRRREFGMLRHIGLRRRDIGALLSLEGALTATTGALVGILAGSVIALILVEVVNRQSFHWSMDMHLPLGALLFFSVLLILLASFAARLSGRQAMRQRAVLAVREDW